MSCDCMDYRQRGEPCKHALAVELLQRCDQRDPEQNDPTITPSLHRACSDEARFELTAHGYAALAASDLEPLP